MAGALLFLGCHGLLAWAEQRVSSGEAALFMTAIPLWLIALESVLLRRPPSRRVVLSLLLGVAGVAVLTWGEGWSGGITDRVVLIVSALFWAVGHADRAPRGRAAPGGAIHRDAARRGRRWCCSRRALAVGEPAGWSPAEITPRASLALVFLILGGTVLGFGAYTWLLRVTSAAAVSSYAFVNPVIALGLAWAGGRRRAVGAHRRRGGAGGGGGDLHPGEPKAEAVAGAETVLEGSTLERAIPALAKRRRGGLAAALFSGYLRRARTSLSS